MGLRSNRVLRAACFWLAVIASAGFCGDAAFVRALGGHDDWIYSLSFSPDGGRLASGGEDGALIVWKTPGGALSARLEAGDAVSCVVYSPDGKYLASADLAGNVMLWNSGSGTRQKTLECGGPVYAAAFSPDSARLSAGLSDGTVITWSVPDGRRLGSERAQNGRVLALAYLPGGKSLASAGLGGGVTITGGEGAADSFKAHDAPVRCLSVSPDGKYLLTCGGGELKLWSVQGKLLEKFESGPQEITAAAFSADGAYVFSGDALGSVRQWRASGGKEQAVIGGHGYSVTALAASPDGNYLVSASTEKDAKLFRVAAPPAQPHSGDPMLFRFSELMRSAARRLMGRTEGK